MRVGSAPLVLVESASAHAAAVAEVSGAGWVVVASAPRPGQVWNSVVTDRSTAAAAVLAAIRGCGLIVLADRTLAADVADDLRGLGSVHYRDDTTPVLDVSSWAMLHAVARGHTVDAAARMLHLSVRTAERRLAAAQRALQVPSLAAAVAQLASPLRITPPPR